MDKTLKQLIDKREESGWQDIKTAPRNGNWILVYGKNSCGKDRVITASYVNKYTLPTEEDWCDEKDNEYYDFEGWYELAHCNDDYNHFAITDSDCKITHWMKIPASPDKPNHDTQIIDGLLEIIKGDKEAMHHVRIMATEAYLDQDGKSIIAASDFQDIQNYLLEALKINTDMEVKDE